MNRFYKISFFILLVLYVVTILGYILWNNNKANQVVQNNQAQISKVSDENYELQRVFDESMVRLDSLTGINNMLMKKLQIKLPKDSIILKLTEPQKRMLRLIDSVNAIKKEINGIAAYMNRNIDWATLNPEQQQVFDDTGIVLGNMLFKLDFAIDQAGIDMLKKNTEALKVVIIKYDKNLEKLDKLAKVLEQFTKYLKISIDVFTAAVSNGIIVSKPTPTIAK
jgi:hypothetical protein